MTDNEDDMPGGRVIFSSDFTRQDGRLIDALHEGIGLLQDQVRSHLPDYLAQRPGTALVGIWEANVSNGEAWRIELTVRRQRADEVGR